MKTRIWPALLALYIAWGTTYLAIRIANETIPPFFMTGTRFLVAGLILYIWRRSAGDPAPTRREWRSAAIVGTFMLVGGIGGVTLAEQFVSSGIAALIVSATPLWVVIIEAIRPGGQRPTWQTIGGVLLGLAGIIILVNPFQASNQEGGVSITAAVVVLLAALSWSIGSIYSRGAELPKSPLLASGIELLAGSAGSFVAGIFLGEGRQLDLAGISLRSISSLGYLIVIGSLVGYVCYTWLLRVAPTNLVVTYAYVNPVVAILVGSLLAQEVLNIRVLMAIPLILSAVGLIHSQDARPKAALPRAMAAQPSSGED